MAAIPPICEFGRPAVNATLPGVDGRRHRLFDHAGKSGLVVAFICNHCPYVQAVISRVVRDATDLHGHGVGFVAINSNDPTVQPLDSFDRMGRFSAEHQFPFPYLHDEDQSIARAYGAVCTPDFFGFNGRFELQYRGRLDAARKEIGDAGLRRDLFEAMIEVAQTGQGPHDQIASIGCSIKWRNDA